MASQGQFFGESFRAKADLSLYPQRFVNLNTSGQVIMAEFNNYAEGVLENQPQLPDMPASISMIGITKVEVDDAYPIGTYLTSGYTGVGTVYTNTNAQYIRAKMLEASAATGDIVMVRLLDDNGPVSGSGPAGATGLQGITGLGTTGIQGLTGVGIQGTTGIGDQGVTGVDGIQGITGIQGETGVGDQGVTGVDGIQGTTGVAGIQGDTGAQGITGVA